MRNCPDFGPASCELLCVDLNLTTGLVRWYLMESQLLLVSYPTPFLGPSRPHRPGGWPLEPAPLGLLNRNPEGTTGAPNPTSTPIPLEGEKEVPGGGQLQEAESPSGTLERRAWVVRSPWERGASRTVQRGLSSPLLHPPSSSYSSSCSSSCSSSYSSPYSSPYSSSWRRTWAWATGRSRSRRERWADQSPSWGPQVSEGCQIWRTA